MSYGLWLSAAGMQANDYRMDVLSNNLANADTVGFKHDVAVVRERGVASASGGAGPAFRHALLDRLSGGTLLGPTEHAFQPGAVTPTGNPLDAAIEGDDFFQVRVGSDVRYTRDGRFTLNSNNELVMAADGGRARVLDDARQPIVLRPGSAPQITSDGAITQDGVSVARIGLVEFADRSSLRKIGHNLFQAAEGARPRPAGEGRLRAGAVEQSTVDPVEGLASLIEVSRAFQLNAAMITLQDTTIGQAVSRVGRIG